MAVATKAQKRYLFRRAAQMGLDVSVLRANFAHEGLSGGIGDGGHAFGPGQMNDAGGVLTGKLPAGWSAKRKNQWAWSKQGIDYLLRGIKSKVGNARGAEAMRRLVYEYERPADMEGAYRERLATWKSGGQNPGVGGIPLAAGKKRQTRFDQELFGNQAMAIFLEASARAAAGDLSAQAELPGMLEDARKASTFNVPVGRSGGSSGAGGAGSDLGGGIGAQAVRMAEKQIGQWYVWGGESRAEGGFDCSGLIQWAYGKAGVNIPRVVTDQMEAGRKIKWKDLRPGDLIGLKGKHIVMYAGNGKVIAAPRTGEKVQYQPLSYFKSQAGYQPIRIGRG